LRFGAESHISDRNTVRPRDPARNALEATALTPRVATPKSC
jgi:hypothetical protein